MVASNPGRGRGRGRGRCARWEFVSGFPCFHFEGALCVRMSACCVRDARSCVSLLVHEYNKTKVTGCGKLASLLICSHWYASAEAAWTFADPLPPPAALGVHAGAEQQGVVVAAAEAAARPPAAVSLVAAWGRLAAVGVARRRLEPKARRTKALWRWSGSRCVLRLYGTEMSRECQACLLQRAWDAALPPALTPLCLLCWPSRR